MDETYLCQRFFTVIFGMDSKFFVVFAFLNKLQAFLELGFSRLAYATGLSKNFPTIFKATFLCLKIQFSIYKKLRMLPWVEITWKCSKNCLLWLGLSIIQIWTSVFLWKPHVRWISANPSSILSNYFYARVALHMKVKEWRYKIPYFGIPSLHTVIILIYVPALFSTPLYRPKNRLRNPSIWHPGFWRERLLEY